MRQVRHITIDVLRFVAERGLPDGERPVAGRGVSASP